MANPYINNYVVYRFGFVGEKITEKTFNSYPDYIQAFVVKNMSKYLDQKLAIKLGISLK